MPLLFFFFIFLAIYAELKVIISVGSSIGAFGVLALLFLTAMVGLWLIRIQGFGVYQKMNQSIAKGKPPVEEISHGFLLLLSGVLLLTPGFITDALGAVLLVPPVRNLIISKGFFSRGGYFYSWKKERSEGPVVIEGEYRERTKGNRPRKKLKPSDENKPK